MNTSQRRMAYRRLLQKSRVMTSPKGYPHLAMRSTPVTKFIILYFPIISWLGKIKFIWVNDWYNYAEVTFMWPKVILADYFEEIGRFEAVILIILVSQKLKKWKTFQFPSSILHQKNHQSSMINHHVHQSTLLLLMFSTISFLFILIFIIVISFVKTLI
jgi:hypothetical protein